MITRRSAPERYVIIALRRQPTDIHDTEIQRYISNLATIMRESGAIFCNEASPFVSDSESMIVKRLAAIQRNGVDLITPTSNRECEAIRHCAALLRGKGINLSIASRNREAFRPKIENAHKTLQPDHLTLLRSRALAFARTRDVASTGEFREMGISRQYLSHLCKSGYLKRVKYGWYSATADAAAQSINT